GRDAQLLRQHGMPLARRGGTVEVLARHQIRIDVVVGERAVFVGPRDAVDAESAPQVVVPERAPEARRLDEDLEPDLALEALVAGDPRVADRGRGDVGVDVERRGPGGPVTRALLAVDRAPGKRRAGEPERL